MDGRLFGWADTRRASGVRTLPQRCRRGNPAARRNREDTCMEKNGLCAEADRRYLECFCRRSRDGLFVRYADPALPDMYCHNFLELRARIGDRLLRKTLEERLHAARAGGAVFFRLELGFDPAA